MVFFFVFLGLVLFYYYFFFLRSLPTPLASSSSLPGHGEDQKMMRALPCTRDAHCVPLVALLKAGDLGLGKGAVRSAPKLHERCVFMVLVSHGVQVLW